MERAKCAVNTAHSAAFFCKCTEPPMLLCLNCLQKHTESESPHQIFSLSSQDQNVLPTLSHSSVSEVCSCCRNLKATELCCCVFPLVLLCRFCKIIHMSKDASASHCFVAAGLKEKLQSQEDVAVMRQRLWSLDVAEGKLLQNISEIAKCEEKFQDRCASLKTQVREHCDRLLDPLKAVQTALQTRLKQDAGEQMDEMQEDSLFRFDDRETDPDFQRLFGIYWESRLDLSGSIACDFSTPDTSQLLAEIYKSIEPLLALSTEDKYLSAFSQKVAQLPGVSAEQRLLYIAEAQVNYYKEHYICVRAREAVISDSLRSMEDAGKVCGDVVESAKIALQQRLKPRSEGLVGKYKESVGRALETIAETMIRAKNLRREGEENKDFGEIELGDTKRRGRPGRRRGRGIRHVHDAHLAANDHHNRRHTAFQLFCHSLTPEAKAMVLNDSKQPGSYLKSISRMWKSLSEEERQVWKEKSLSCTSDFVSDFPLKRVRAQTEESKSEESGKD